MKMKIAKLKETVSKAIKTYGYTDKEASVILDVLMYAQLRGNNQGIVKLIGQGIPKSDQAGEIKILKETKLSALLDGNHNMGMIVKKKALEMAIKKAKEHGFGIVGTNNTASSTGALGYYAREIAREGMIGFVFAGSPPTVCHHGSYEALYGTNPMAIGIPSEAEPLVLDMATAAMAFYGLIEAKTAGKQIPVDIAYDSEGHLTTDPAEAMKGALRPFDRSYKGANLAMMVEVFTGPLVGAAFVGIGEKADWGNLIYVIDPELLTDRKEFKKKVSQLIEKVKKVKKLPGVKEILVPSERGNRLTKQRLEAGEIEVEDHLWKELKKVAGKN